MNERKMKQIIKDLVTELSFFFIVCSTILLGTVGIMLTTEYIKNILNIYFALIIFFVLFIFLVIIIIMMINKLLEINLFLNYYY